MIRTCESGLAYNDNVLYIMVDDRTYWRNKGDFQCMDDTQVYIVILKYIYSSS